MYLAQSVTAGGFGTWREAIDKVEAMKPRHIVAGHQNKRLDDDAGRTIAESRQYLDDAEELLRTETTAVDFFDAEIARYLRPPRADDPVGRRQRAVRAREHPEADVGEVILGSWL